MARPMSREMAVLAPVLRRGMRGEILDAKGRVRLSRGVFG